MKFLTAIINPGQIDAVREALVEMAIPGTSVSEVMDYDPQKCHDETYRGAGYRVDLNPRIKIEVALGNEQLEAAYAAFTRAAGTHKLYVCELDQAVLIRTGETGIHAL